MKILKTNNLFTTCMFLMTKKKKTLLKNECGQKWCQSQFTKYRLQLTITRSCRKFDDSRLVDFNSWNTWFFLDLIWFLVHKPLPLFSFDGILMQQWSMYTSIQLIKDPKNEIH
jgi:hypothetical protein